MKVNLPNHKTFMINDVQTTLFYYEFKPLYQRIKTKSLSLFDKKDIAADKAYTLGRRPMWRDYVDLFFLLKDKHHTLRQIVKDAQQKFKTLFEPKLFLEQLTYYKDIIGFKVKFIEQKYSPKYIQDFLKKEVLGYVQQAL